MALISPLIFTHGVVSMFGCTLRGVVSSCGLCSYERLFLHSKDLKSELPVLLAMFVVVFVRWCTTALDCSLITLCMNALLQVCRRCDATGGTGVEGSRRCDPVHFWAHVAAIVQ
jgi:hypothetical protein